MENNANKISNIPRRLEIKDRPELNNFSLNVLFTSINNEKEKDSYSISFALYLPDLSTFKETEKIQQMDYFNEMDRNFWLRITFNKKSGFYFGFKRHGKKEIGGASGISWEIFFFYLTTLGVYQIKK